jgi:hypothetical protein
MKGNKTLTVLLIAIGLLFVGMFIARRNEGFNDKPDIPNLKSCTNNSDCPDGATCKGGYCISTLPITIVRTYD